MADPVTPRPTPQARPVDALAYIGSGCPHCPAVVDGLTRLVKDGRLRRVEVVNLSVTQAAPGDDIRAVPWVRIGPFELIGAMSPSDLGDWVDRAAADDGWAAYHAYLIDHRRLEEAGRLARERPGTLVDLLGLLASPDTSLSVRIGIGALVEDLAATPMLARAVPMLVQLTLSDLPQARADACHFLGLSMDPAAIAAARRLLDDDHPDVREIAAETLALLGATQTLDEAL